MGHFFLAHPAVTTQVAGSQLSAARTQHPGASLVYRAVSDDYRAVSDDTLGSFWSLFPGSSVLQCHGVFPSGTYVFAAASGRSSQSSQQQSSQQSRRQVAGSQSSAARTQVAGSQSSAARSQHPGASLVYRAVSDDTLGSCWALFPGPSVLQCHGVFPSGTCGFAAASGRSS